MRIDRNSRILERPFMFADGERGFFMQQYELSCNGKPLNVTAIVSGHKGANDTTRMFHTANGKFDSLSDALIDAGHEVVDHE